MRSSPPIYAYLKCACALVSNTLPSLWRPGLPPSPSRGRGECQNDDGRGVAYSGGQCATGEWRTLVCVCVCVEQGEGPRFCMEPFLFFFLGEVLSKDSEGADGRQA